MNDFSTFLIHPRQSENRFKSKLGADVFNYRQLWQQKTRTQRIDYKSIVIRRNIGRTSTKIWLDWM